MMDRDSHLLDLPWIGEQQLTLLLECHSEVWFKEKLIAVNSYWVHL